jgi:hypothetical protein
VLSRVIRWTEELKLSLNGNECKPQPDSSAVSGDAAVTTGVTSARVGSDANAMSLKGVPSVPASALHPAAAPAELRSTRRLARILDTSSLRLSSAPAPPSRAALLTTAAPRLRRARHPWCRRGLTLAIAGAEARWWWCCPGCLPLSTRAARAAAGAGVITEASDMLCSEATPCDAERVRVEEM